VSVIVECLKGSSILIMSFKKKNCSEMLVGMDGFLLQYSFWTISRSYTLFEHEFLILCMQFGTLMVYSN